MPRTTTPSMIIAPPPRIGAMKSIERLRWRGGQCAAIGNRYSTRSGHAHQPRLTGERLERALESRQLCVGGLTSGP